MIESVVDFVTANKVGLFALFIAAPYACFKLLQFAPYYPPFPGTANKIYAFGLLCILCGSLGLLLVMLGPLREAAGFLRSTLFVGVVVSIVVHAWALTNPEDD